MSQTPPSITADSADRFCHHCGYNLRGIASTTCPECGLAVGAADVFVIPWENRRKFGRFSTFLRTAALATFRPKRFATAIGAPIDDRAARRFRLIVVLLAALPIVVSLGGVMIAKHGAGFLLEIDSDFLRRTLDPQAGRSWQLPFIFWAGATIPLVLPIGVLVTFILGIATPGNWFRTRQIDEEKEMRLAAISRYICAAWAWLAVPTGILVIGLLIAMAFGGPHWNLDGSVPFASGAGTFFIILAAWWCNLRMLARTVNRGLGYLIAAAVAFPIGWAVSAVIGLVLFPCLIGFVWIVIDSLRR